MSIRIMSAVWDNGPNDKSEILVLIALADFCNDAGECWPSVAGIARKSRMTERGVQKIIARLCDLGWVKIDQNAGRKGCNLYTISPPNPVHPEPNSPPNPVRATPEPRSPKPPNPVHPNLHITINEPSSVIEAAMTAKDFILSVHGVSVDAADSFLSYRKASKAKAITPTGARRLASTLWDIVNKGGDPNDALALTQERGWVSIQSDWYFKAKESNYDPRTSNASTSQSRRAGDGSATVDAFREIAARYGSGPQ